MMKRNDLDFEVSFYEKIIAEKPDHIEALTLLAEAYTARGEYKKGFEMDKRLAILKPKDEMVQYNLACSFALTGDTEKALEALSRAVELGYRDFAHLSKDSDFATIKNHPKFQEILMSLKKYFGEDGNE